jgi:hypothetical protein
MKKALVKRIVFLLLFTGSIITERIIFLSLRPFVDMSENLYLGFVSLPGYWLYILIAVVILALIMIAYVKLISLIDKKDQN